MRWRRGNGWRLLDARSGSSRDLPIAGDRPRVVERRRGQRCGVTRYSMLPLALPGLGAPSASPESRERACVTRLSVPPTRRRHLPECRLDHEALPEDAYAFGRGQQFLSCRRAASLLGLPLQCAYRTPRPGISTWGPARASHRSRPRAGPRALRNQLDPTARGSGQTGRERPKTTRSLGVRTASSVLLGR
jgi:hypothetical protein